MATQMLVDVIHEGNCEQRYHGQSLVVICHGDDAPDDVANRIQSVLDEWRKSNPDRVDEHGSADGRFPIDEVARIINGAFYPDVLTTVSETPIRSVFL